MAFSGGTFSRTFDCTTDRDNGVKILASKFDTELDGMATGLSTCILKDGTQTCTAAIPFAEGLTVPDNKTIVLGTNSDITIQYDESTNDSLEIAANVEGAALGIVLKADQGDDNADQHKVNIADGGTLTMASKISGSFVSYLTHTPNSTVADSTTAVAGNLTVGGDLTLGSGAVISEAELEKLDGITNGTVAADKAVVVDSNKDIASFRNITLTGELDAGSLDVSGDADIDGTLEADAITVNGTALNTVIAGVTVTDATNSAHVLVTDNESTNEENLITFVEDATSSTGNVGLEMDGNLTYNPSTGTVTATVFKGNIDAVDGDFDGTLEADAMTLNGTAITATATLDTGISNNNVPKFTSGVADNDFLRVDGTAIEGRSASEVLSDIAAAPAAGDSNIVTTGALNSGSITSGFGSIDNGSSAITTTGVITGGTLEATADTSAGDNAAIGYTAAEGLILTGQGSTSDITVKNDADATVFTVPTGTDDILFPDNAKIILGTSSDLQLSHDGSNSIIHDNGTGGLRLQTNSLRVLKADASENIIQGTADGSVILYHNNGVKLTTATTGVDITGGITATAASTITTADNTVQLTLKSTDADGSIGPKFDLTRDSSSPANGDNCGQINFNIDNNAGESTQYGDIFVGATSVTDGSESAHMTFSTMKGGSRNSRMKLHSDETVFNEDSVDVDFRVETDGDSHALFVEGSTNFVGISENDPDRQLHVSSGTSNVVAKFESTDVTAAIEFTDNGGSAEIGTVSGAVVFFPGGVQKMLVTSLGRVGIGQSSPAGRLDVNNDGATTETLMILSDFGGTGAHTQISFNNTNGQVGTINTSGSATSYNTSSDYRLKENVNYTWDATTRLKQLKPARFNFIADADTTVDGFLAHEVSSIVPEAINGTKDETRSVSNAILSASGSLLFENITKDDWTAGKLATKDAEGNDVDALYPSDSTWTANHTEPVMQGIDQSKLVPLLCKTILELEARITALEAG